MPTLLGFLSKNLPCFRTPKSAKDNRLHSHETSRIEQLPDDVLLHILSFLNPLFDRVHTSFLSRRWRNLWRITTCLDFDHTTELPIDLLNSVSIASYIERVNKFLDARAALPGLPLVKKLRFQVPLGTSHGDQIERWINFAIENRVETLNLEFNPYPGPNSIGPTFIYEQYILSEELWHRVPSGLSNIKCLKSLSLSSVNVSKHFIQFVISSCPLLENLTLHHAACFDNLDVSGVPPLKLRRLKIIKAKDFALARLCAPHLTSFYYDGSMFNPQAIDVPMLTDLTIGSLNFRLPQPIMEYLKHFWCYLPQLKKLELIICDVPDFQPKIMPELVKLRYLKLSIRDGDYNSILFRIMNFINACPLLETFALKLYDGGLGCSPLSKRQLHRKQKWLPFKCLKVLELYGGGLDAETIDQTIVRFIIRNAPNLKKLNVDVRDNCSYPIFLLSRPELIEVVKAKAKEVCQDSCSEIKITVVG